MTVSMPRRLLAFGVRAGFSLLLAVVFGEGLLRIQQAFGPLADLEMKSLRLDVLSDVLNHVNHPGGTVIETPDGREATIYHDQYGMRVMRQELPAERAPYKILFIGDSFIAGLEDPHTVPEHVRERFARSDLHDMRIRFLNAGCSSYSPAIFIPLAKQLIPAFHPTMVVVDIDETDLGDDFLRYRKLIVRDDEGKVVGVKSTPIHREFLFVLDRIRRHPSYLVRLFWKVYHTRVHMPRLQREYRTVDARDVLQFASDTSQDARQKYQREIAFFEGNVNELMEELIALTGDRSKLLFVRHPHLGHLMPNSDGLYWNSFGSDSVRRLAARHGISFYDSTNDLRRIFGRSPENYYFPGDMHFNREGLRAYGTVVGEKVLQTFTRILETTEKGHLAGVPLNGSRARPGHVPPP